MIPPKHPFAVFLALLIGATCSFAEIPTGWRYHQTVEVSKDGIYRIELPSETIDALRPGLDDLRIFDPEGHEVAYLREPEQERSNQRRATVFTPSLDPTATTVLLETGASSPFSAIALESPARAFLKSARIEGSHDKKEWKELAAGQPIFRMAEGREELALQFPPGTWEYLRVTLDDARSAPIPITGAIIFNAPPATVEETAPIQIISRDELPGATRLAIRLPAGNLRVAAIRLYSPDPAFSRAASLSSLQVGTNGLQETRITEGLLSQNENSGSQARPQLVLNSEPLPKDLVLLIQNQDSPPLSITSLSAVVKPARILFSARSGGVFTLVSGNPAVASPHYDLQPVLSAIGSASSTALPLSAVRETPGWVSPDPLPGMGETGSALDLPAWKYYKPLAIIQPGAQQVELDEETVSHAQADFRDLRLVTDGRQIPYLLERTSIEREVTVKVSLANDPNKPRMSRWTLDFPRHSLPITQITLSTSTPLFERALLLYELLPDVPDETGLRPKAGFEIEHSHELAHAIWKQSPGAPPSDCLLRLSERPRQAQLWLETDDGDNSPITITRVRAWRPVTHLVFKATTENAGAIRLYYGNPDASAPSYDLALAAHQLLRVPKSVAELGAETAITPIVAEKPAPGTFTLWQTIAFWTVLAGVAAALLLVIHRMLPKTGTGDSSGSPE